MNGSGGLEKWSFVQELFKRKELAAYRAKPENIDEFVTMVVDKKLKQGTDVRKLEKVIKRAIILADDEECLGLAHLAPEVMRSVAPVEAPAQEATGLKLQR